MDKPVIICFQMNPFAQRSFKHEVRSASKSLRQFALDVINKRKESLKNDDYVPDDILTSIIKLEGELNKSCMLNTDNLLNIFPQ